jgi:hypothetical protein
MASRSHLLDRGARNTASSIFGMCNDAFLSGKDYKQSGVQYRVRNHELTFIMSTQVG